MFCAENTHIPFSFLQKKMSWCDWNVGWRDFTVETTYRNSRTRLRGWPAPQIQHLLMCREKPPGDFRKATPEIISLSRYKVPYELYYYFSWFSLTSHYDFFPWQENCSQPLTVNHKLTEQNKIKQWSNPQANLMKPKSRRAVHFCRQWSYLISWPCFHF